MQKNLHGGSGGADSGMTGAEPHGQESLNRRLQDLSRVMTMGERSQQQMSQSITEVSGFSAIDPSRVPIHRALLLQFVMYSPCALVGLRRVSREEAGERCGLNIEDVQLL